MSREVNQIIRAACGRGWSAEIRNGGHIKLTHPNGNVVFSSRSPSCYRGLKNLEHQIRRAERNHSV